MNRRLVLRSAVGLVVAAVVALLLPEVRGVRAQENIPRSGGAEQPERPEAGPEEFEEIVERLTEEDVEALLKRLGFDFEGIEPETYKFEMDGFVVVLFSSETNLRLYAGFTQEKGLGTIYELPRLVNEWNRTKRFSRAFIDTEGDPCVESDLDLEGGVTYGAIDEFFRTFAIIVPAFAEFLSGPEEPVDDEEVNKQAARPGTLPRPAIGRATAPASRRPG